VCKKIFGFDLEEKKVENIQLQRFKNNGFFVSFSRPRLSICGAKTLELGSIIDIGINTLKLICH
jgi:hypothetical protein